MGRRIHYSNFPAYIFLPSPAQRWRREIAESDGETWNHRGKMTVARAYHSTHGLQCEEVYRYDTLNRNITKIRSEGSSTETKYSIYCFALVSSKSYRGNGKVRVVG